MSRITDYGFLFQTTFGTSKTNLVNNIQLSQMNMKCQALIANFF